MDAWVHALVALAPQLERPVVKARIVPLALSKAQAHETSVQARPKLPQFSGSLSFREHQRLKMMVPVLRQHFKPVTLCVIPHDRMWVWPNTLSCNFALAPSTTTDRHRVPSHPVHQDPPLPLHCRPHH